MPIAYMAMPFTRVLGRVEQAVAHLQAVTQPRLRLVFEHFRGLCHSLLLEAAVMCCGRLEAALEVVDRSRNRSPIRVKLHGNCKAATLRLKGQCCPFSALLESDSFRHLVNKSTRLWGTPTRRSCSTGSRGRSDRESVDTLIPGVGHRPRRKARAAGNPDRWSTESAV